ncbi:MAG: MarR family transcriptional regulator [Chloroflexi bacterium]|nr:MarR family transcriptional regulator [Chloroflexota bacterium]
MTKAKDNNRLSPFLDDIMVQFPLVARKISIATRDKTSPILSDMQVRLLYDLAIDPMTPSEISRLHGISKPNVTTLISALVLGGYAQRSHDNKDRRIIYITITNKGKRLVQRRRKIIKEYVLQVLGRLNENEIEDIFLVMEKYRDILVKVNSIL